MCNKIVLEFDKTKNNLAGFNYGLEIYLNQVDGKININLPFTIVFPDYISNIAISFVQGFFSKILEQIGYEETINNLTIKSKNDNLTKRILDRIY